jgi:membrane protease YdiL (CAAX protease family)
LFVGENANLWRLVYWAVITILFYLIIPACVIVFIFKEPLNTYGLKQKDMFHFSGVYVLLFICIFPAVFVASFTVDFQNTYPYSSPINLKGKMPYLLVWECFYVVQFFAVEFFYRGFIIHGLKKQLGISSVWVMVPPYCMIHFGKPLPDCVGSIFAGIVLGVMSYRTGSIWLGAAIHIAVALSMDLLSLFHKGFIF